jgi:uncharacterized membrane protein YdbT with pleckstrin-like domain
MSKPTANGVIEIKPSLIPFAWKGLITFAFGLALLAGSSVIQLPMALGLTGGYILILAGLGVIGLGILMILAGLVRRNMYTYKVTDSYIAIQKQLLRRSVRQIPFSSLSDVEASQSLVGRLAGFGNIVPITKSGYGVVHGMDHTENIVAEMSNAPHPDKVANLIMSRASLMPKPTVL